jgi:hypothetical protein
VSTVLSSPYSDDALLSIFPDGSYHLGQSSDTVLESGITLMGGYPLLTISESISQKQVAQVLYQMRGANIEACQISSTDMCDTLPKKPTIRLTLPKQTNASGSVRAGVMTLSNANNILLTVNTDGSISKDAGITLSPAESESRGLEMIISDGDTEIGRLSYMTDSRLSVARAGTDVRNTPTLVQSGFGVSTLPYGSLTSGVTGIQITRPVSHRTIDTISTGPNHTQSIGAIDSIPGVGWQGSNTMLLSYAAGDTV